MNIRLKVTYDGTKFYGFQKQPKLKTVESVLTKAIEDTVKHKVKLFYSGRTDRGVHALGQYVNFYSKTTIDLGNLPRVINFHLPNEISVIEAKLVKDDFHCRYNSIEKHYRYVIFNGKYKNALFYNRSWHYPFKIDEDKLKKSHECLIGEHDFKSFMGRDAIVKDTIRTLYRIDVKKEDNFIYIDFYGKSFLKNMIRIIVGTAVQIASSDRDVDLMREALYAKERKSAGLTAPPHGLYLMNIRFDEEK